jgi:heterotetrameric sarcosine oxidase gamma subunit
VRSIQTVGPTTVYRLTESRAVVFGSESLEGAINVTGGWATITLIGLDATQILNKLTAVDLRETTLPVGHCCQGPLFGVNVLFGRLADGFELHACPDSLQFLWELLLDAGDEFQLQPAGAEWFASRKTTSAT